MLLDSTEIKLFNKILSRLWDKSGGDVEIYDLSKELESLLGKDSFTYQERVFGIWNFITNEKGEDPFDYTEEEDRFLINNFYGDTIIKILNDSGWMDKYFTLDTFIVHPSKFNTDRESKSVYGDIKVEGNKLFLICDDWSDFSILFNSDDKYVAESVLGQDWGELYGWFDVDFEGDVWDNLDEKSLQHIKEYIIENDFIGKPLDYDEDPDDGGLRVDMLKDNGLLGQLIDNESMFDDLKRELENFYRWAYESAAEDDLFIYIKNEIVSLIGSEGDWGMVKSKKEGGSDKHVLKFDVTDKFMGYNIDYLECKGEFPQHQENYFLNVIEEYLDCMGDMLNTPDMGYFYPDSTKVDEHLNHNVLANL